MLMADQDRFFVCSTCSSSCCWLAGVLQAKPQPAEISEGTGIIRPGTEPSAAAACTAMASAVLSNVTTA